MNVSSLSFEIRQNIAKVLIGKPREVDMVLTALFAGGHVLLEDVPGTGKTTLANALAASMSLKCSRIQFTPDLLPGDVTGVDFFNMKTQEFTFTPGPVFTNILIADEINRATPRTQSALLEAMQENQVTVGRQTYRLAEPFFVIATQNPIETQGTFPLPEAQTDRFIMKLSIGYPENQSEKNMLRLHRRNVSFMDIPQVCTGDAVKQAQAEVIKVKVSEPLEDYIISIVQATRTSDKIRLGVSPRGSIALMRCAQAHAAIDGRDYLLPDDVKAVAVPCLAHRIISSSQRSLRMSEANRAIIEYIIDTQKAPIV